MKKTGALFLLMAAMIVAVPAYNTAWAAPRGPYPESGWRHPAIAPEKQAAYDKIMSDYADKARPMHNDLWAKQTELEYLSRNDKATPGDISKMVNEIRVLREKCLALHDSTAGRLAKDLGITSDHANSLIGMGGCGTGCGGYGYGGPRGYRGGHGGWHR